jgi:uncharacterized protein (TIGR03083 family)
METIETLIQQLEDSRQELWSVISNFLPQQEIYPGWTLKEMLAHLAGWDEATIASLRIHLGDLEGGAPAALGINAFNTESVETRKGLTLEQVTAESEQTREQLKALLRTVPSDRLEEELVASWGPTVTVRNLIRVFIHHERAHAQEIRDQLK